MGQPLARANERVAQADARTLSLYPNPTLLAGTSTQTAKLSVGSSIPLMVLGQRGAAMRAGEAQFAAARIDTEVAVADGRSRAAKAFVALWLAERTAGARADGASVAARLESAVSGRVEVGAAAELEGLRVHAERLRAETDAATAAEMVDAASAELAAWIGAPMGVPLRTDGDPELPASTPSLEELLTRAQASPAVRRAQAEVRASNARAASERAQVRPMLTLDLGADFLDPTLPATNYRAQLGIELPLLNQRGPFIEREERKAAAAESQVRAEQVQAASGLLVAYRNYNAFTRQAKALAETVVPSARAAAKATEESYALGRAPLVAVLEVERARIDVELSLLEAEAARANAWIDVEWALGTQ